MAEYGYVTMPDMTKENSRKVSVVGVGETDFHDDYRAERKREPGWEPPTDEKLCKTAFERALADAGLKPEAIDGLAMSYTYGGPEAHEMAKSLGNVVNPDDIIAEYGADTLRLYEMFMGPLEQVKPWNTRGVEGTHRFLNRVWRLIAAGEGDGLSDKLVDDAPSKEQLIALHQTIAKVTDDIEGLRFNTAIAALMELSNAAGRWQTVPRELARSFVLLLAPLAPHIAEELWSRLGAAESLAYAAWPQADQQYLQRDTLEVAVQVNGKVRGRIEIPADAAEAEVLAIARRDANVLRHLEGRDIKRAIYVPQRIVNFVVGG